MYEGHTLAEAIRNWIGPGEHGEAEFIAKKLGIGLNTLITDQFLRSDRGIALMKAQAAYEGQNVISDKDWQRAQDWAYKGIKATQPDQTSTKTPEIHIQYSPTIHIHGDASEKKLAAAHVEHVRQMKEMLASLEWDNDRRQFSTV